MTNINLKISILLFPLMLNAQNCDLLSNRYKSIDDSILGKMNEYLSTDEVNDISKVYIDVLLNTNKCKASHPLQITISNNSNKAIDNINLEIGSWLTKKSGKSYYVGNIIHNIKDDKYTDFYIEPRTNYTFCSQAPNEEWKYKYEGISSLFGRKKVKLLHTFEIDALDYALINNGCFVGFND